MKTLSKEQLATLDADQQKYYATVELSGARKRQRLLEQVRSQKGRSFLDMIVAIPMFLALLVIEDVAVKFAVLALSLLSYFQLQLMQRRVDTIVELLSSEPERKN